MAEDRMRWSDIRGSSSSSVEPSMSSLTNGTHSSLNSEMEEEELAYSIEPTVQKNLHLHFNGHLSGKSRHMWNNECVGLYRTTQLRCPCALWISVGNMLNLKFYFTLSDQNHHSAESDNEEFCDSMEHLAVEEVGSLLTT